MLLFPSEASSVRPGSAVRAASGASAGRHTGVVDGRAGPLDRLNVSRDTIPSTRDFLERHPQYLRGKKRRSGTASADQPGSSPAARATAYGPSRSWSCGGMSRCLCGGDRWAWSAPISPRRCQRYMKSVISSSTAAATITISRAATLLGRWGRRGADERQRRVRRQVLGQLAVPLVDRLERQVLGRQRRRLSLLRVRQALRDDQRGLSLGPRLLLELLGLKVLLVRDLRREDRVVELLRELVVGDREFVDDDEVGTELVLQHALRLDGDLLALLDQLETGVLGGDVLEGLLDLLVDDPLLVVRADVLEDQRRLRGFDVEVDGDRRVDRDAVFRRRAGVDLFLLDARVEDHHVVAERDFGVDARVEDVRMVGVDGAEVLDDADLADADLRERSEDREDEYEQRGDADDPDADDRSRWGPPLGHPDGHAFPPSLGRLLVSVKQSRVKGI